MHRRHSDQTTRNATTLRFSDAERIPQVEIVPQDVILDPPYPVGQGGSCDLYRGTHPALGVIALKRPRTTAEGMTKALERQFKGELLTWLKLDHTNLLQFYGVIEIQNRLHLVSPWMDGGSLPDYLKQYSDSNRASLNLLNQLLQVADAICYLHDHGIVHGDIKGSNILVSGSDVPTPVLADWASQN